MTPRALTAPVLVIGASLLWGCADAERTIAAPRAHDVATAIADGARGGNPEFFWLPPTVPTAPDATGPFDATALSELVVEVCALDASGGCVVGEPLGRFTPTSDPVPQRITVDAAGEYYSVTWLTGRSQVSLEQLYRVRVLRNGVELGFLDVQFVRDMTELDDIDATSYVGVKRGQQLRLRFRIDEPSARTYVRVNEIESSGGTPGDWIELYNTSGVPLSLAGYVVRDASDNTYVLPAGAIIPAGGYYLIDEAVFNFGLGGSDAVRLFTPDGGTLVDSYAWTAHATTTYGRCPDGGEFATTTVPTKGAANDCSTPRPRVVINEVESSGGTPGDWVELYNAGAAPADISGYIFRDNDDGHTFVIPAGTIIPAGGFFVANEAELAFGLGSADAARLFDAAGELVDSFTWTVNAAVTYGRCPDGTGEFSGTSAATKGSANACTGAGGTP